MILLGIGHPDHRIDAWQDRLDPLAMGPFDRIEVRQVEDRHVTERVAGVVADLLLRPTPSQSSRPAMSARLDRGTQANGSAVVGRRAEASLTDDPARALSRLDLPDPGPADEGQHVGLGREAEPLGELARDSSRVIRPDPDLGGGRDGVVESLQARTDPGSPVDGRAQSGSASGSFAAGPHVARRRGRGSATLIVGRTRRRRPPRGGVRCRPVEQSRPRIHGNDCRQPPKLLGRVAQVGGQRLEVVGRRRERIEPRLLLGERLDERIVQAPPRTGDQLDHRRLAEQGAEQLLVDEGRGRRDPDLGPGQAGRVDERREHHPHADRIDPDRCALRKATLPLARLGDIGPDRGDPVLEPRAEAVVEAGRWAPQRRDRPRRHRRPSDPPTRRTPSGERLRPRAAARPR